MNDTGSLLDLVAPDEATTRDAGKLHVQRAHDDYSTPPHYAERIRAALGGTIGCDPASSDVDNLTIQARTYWTHDRSGLDQRHAWRSPVYLLPPSVNRDEFLARTAREAAAGAEIIVRLNLKHLCAGYAQTLLPYVSAMHVPRGRPAFLHPVTRARSESPTDGRAFLYVGSSPSRFVEEFRKDVGWTMLCVHPAPERRRARPQAEVVHT